MRSRSATRDEGSAVLELAHQPRVNAEDTALITGVQQGMSSSSFTHGPLGESEVCLRSFGRKLRALIPEARLYSPPAAGWSQKKKSANRNAACPVSLRPPHLFAGDHHDLDQRLRVGEPRLYASAPGGCSCRPTRSTPRSSARGCGCRSPRYGTAGPWTCSSRTWRAGGRSRQGSLVWPLTSLFRSFAVMPAR